MSLARRFNAWNTSDTQPRVALATPECPMIRTSLTRRGIKALTMQALQCLPKLTCRYAAECVVTFYYRHTFYSYYHIKAFGLL